MFALAALSAMAAIASDWRRRLPSFYLFKPLTTALLLAAAAWTSPVQGGDYRQWMLAGLALCWLGDVALMFAGSRAFLAGLSAFLLGHLAFCAALLQHLHAAIPWWFVVAPLLGAAGGLRLRRLRLPVALYAATLLAMLELAAWRALTLNLQVAWLALAGAAAFTVSDAMLARRRFIGDFTLAQALILSSYWLGIGLLAASV